MNQLLRWSSNLWNNGRQLLQPLSVPIIDSTAPVSSSQIDTLYLRISRVRDPSLSIVPILDQWLEEGKAFEPTKLRKSIRRLCQRHCYSHALQVLDWMTNQRGFKLSGSDVTFRLCLLSKVHGLEKAEEYFNSISMSYRSYRACNVLLRSYAEANQLEKAEAMFQIMKDLGFAEIASSYPTMQDLYCRMGKREKMEFLRQEMEENDIMCNIFTFNKRLHAYVACSNIEGMEKLIKNMFAYGKITMNFTSCILAANGYLKAGLFSKTVKMLKRSEKLIVHNYRKTSYETLLGLYAAIGNHTNVYRIWDLYKQMEMLPNTGYICMISALLKLDDLDGAEKIWKEWDSGKNIFDIHIPNLMISAFSREGALEKAEAYIHKIVEKGKKPDSASWGHLATGYLQHGQMTKAIDSIKKATSTCGQQWIPGFDTLAKCLKYLKSQGDREAAEELLKTMKKQCLVSIDAYNRLASLIND